MDQEQFDDLARQSRQLQARLGAMCKEHIHDEVLKTTSPINTRLAKLEGIATKASPAPSKKRTAKAKQKKARHGS